MVIWRLIGRKVQVANTALIALAALRPVQSVQQNFANSNIQRDRKVIVVVLGGVSRE